MPDRELLSDDDVRRIASLARIHVEEQALKDLRGELDSIMGMIAELLAVDTRGVEPMAHAQELPLRLRPDDVTETDQRDAFQAVAPQVARGLYLVPRVLD